MACLGLALYKQGKPDEAVAEYEKAIAIDRDDGGTHWNLAIACWELNRHAEAKKAAQATVRLDPTNAEAPEMIEELEAEGY